MPRTIGDGYSTFADSTLMTMSKKDLIHTIRLLEKNLRSAKEQNDRQYKMLVSRENAFAKGYAQGKEDAIEDFATNLVGEISDYESAGHNLDVVRWVEYYKAEVLKEVE